jgi:DUF971 family protein
VGGWAHLRVLRAHIASRNEWTGERVLKAENVSEELTIADLEIVGRYALNFKWSDGHETGIYSFRYLRELCEKE